MMFASWCSWFCLILSLWVWLASMTCFWLIQYEGIVRGQRWGGNGEGMDLPYLGSILEQIATWFSTSVKLFFLSVGLKEASRHIVNCLWWGFHGKAPWAVYKGWRFKLYSHKEMNSDSNQIKLGRGLFSPLSLQMIL